MTSQKVVSDTAISNHEFSPPTGDQLLRIEALKQGQKMQDLPIDLWHASFKKYVLDTPYRGGGPNLRLIRLVENLPSLTVTGFIFNKFIHPTENRYITVREAARLQGLPDDMEFAGGIGSTRQQVGNAVPPLLAQNLIDSVARPHISSPGEKLTTMSLFAGAGGFDVAADRSEFVEVGLATDIWEDSVQTLGSWVRGDYPVIQADICTIGSAASFWSDATGQRDLPQMIIGGPPCQSFSQAGKQKGEVDERGRLVFEFLNVVEETAPEVFILENVANIRSIAKGALLEKMLRTAKEMGYSTDWRILDATFFGVPQRRKRFFMIGSRSQDARTLWPDDTHGPTARVPFCTVSESFAGLPAARTRR